MDCPGSQVDELGEQDECTETMGLGEEYLEDDGELVSALPWSGRVQKKLESWAG